MNLSGRLCAAARAMLHWSREKLVSKSGVSMRSIARFEQGLSTPLPRTLRDLVETFEAAGLVFVAPGEDHEGGILYKKGFDFSVLSNDSDDNS